MTPVSRRSRVAPPPPPPSPEQQFRDIAARWREDPIAFVQQAILEPYNAATGQHVTMTTQQREATEAVRDLVHAKLAVHRGAATPAQQDLAGKLGVTIMAGKGIGKDAWVAWMTLWFVSLFPYCKVPCTSVSADQIQKVLWSEIAKWLQHSVVQSWLTLQSDKLYYRLLPDDIKGRRWFAFPKTANPKATEQEQTEGSAGIHEDYLMVVVDEASGLADAEFQPFEGTLTGLCNFFVMIFNPTRNTGYAIDSHGAKAHRWITLHWNAEDSELADAALHQRLAEDYGRESNPYRIRVLGLPPVHDEQTLMPWMWIEEAAQREIEGQEEMPLIFGVDCGAGGDHSIIVRRRGYQVLSIHRMKSPDSTTLTQWVGTAIDADRPDGVEIDTIGIGWAVEGQLRELKGAVVRAADARRTADRPEKYWNKRAEMYDRLREAMERGLLSIPRDQALMDQLACIKVEYVGSKLKIVEKKKLKAALGGHSPDEADALALTFYRAATTRMTATRASKPIRRAVLLGDWRQGAAA